MEEYIIKQYKTKNGYIFDSKEDCIKAEEVEKKCQGILDFLIDTNKYDVDCSFSNGHGYIQYDSLVTERMKDIFHEIASNIIRRTPDEKFDKYYIGRYLDDGNYRFLYKLWRRLHNIDNLGREFGQQYYTLNPSKSKLFQLNK